MLSLYEKLFNELNTYKTSLFMINAQILTIKIVTFNTIQNVANYIFIIRDTVPVFITIRLFHNIIVSIRTKDITWSQKGSGA